MRLIIIAVLIVTILGAGGTALYLFRQEQKNKNANESLEAALTLFSQEKFAGVVDRLRPVYDTFPKYERIGEIIALLAECYENADITDSAAIAEGLWRELADDHPESEKAGFARLRLGQILLEREPAEAKSYFDAVEELPDPELSSLAKVGQAQLLEAAGEVEDALRIYHEVIQSSGSKNAQHVAFDRLSESNHRRIFTPQMDEFSQIYTVKRGDSLYSIAIKNHCSVKYLLATNNLTGELRPGQRIKIPAQGWRIVVDKEDLHLYLLTDDGRFVMRYRVGTGEQDYKTPEGQYRVKNKEKEPVWYKPGGGIIRYGEEGHALGTRWMGIETLEGDRTGLGIHGTDEPETVGQRKSAGCIRMLNEKVEELFTITPVKTPVDIVKGFRLSDYQSFSESEAVEGAGAAGDDEVEEAA